MANVALASGGQITAVNTYEIGDDGQAVVGTRVVHFVGSSPVGASITVKGRATGSAATYVPIPYAKIYINGAVGDKSIGSAAITTDSLIYIPCSGMDVALDCTALTSGSFTVWIKGLVGAAA